MNLRILNINNRCTGCGACVSVCAKGALRLEYDSEGFYYPILDSTKCVGCRLCEKVCHALYETKHKEIVRDYSAFMVKAYDKNLLKKSSSGGVFSLLAEAVLKEGGIVYGARYNYELERLEHCSTDEVSLDELRKSKYVESYMGNTFLDVRRQLQSGRKVLFCGTPCQVKGLCNYLKTLRTNTENLFAVRFVCHGVPSNRFLTEYKHWKEKKVGAKIVHMDFRPKTRGWRMSNMLLKFENGKVIDELYQENYYYYYFQKNLSLRRSCYNCHLIEESFSDYTIADFWGIHKYQPQNKDSEGISLVLAHNQKAESMLELLDCDVERLPQQAVEYIYKDAIDKKVLFDERNKEIQGFIREGYMNHTKRVLRNDIIIFKIKTRIGALLRKSALWRKIRK